MKITPVKGSYSRGRIQMNKPESTIELLSRISENLGEMKKEVDHFLIKTRKEQLLFSGVELSDILRSNAEDI